MTDNKNPFKLDAMSLTELRDMCGLDLKVLTDGAEITVHGKAVAVLLPYNTYLQIQKLILDCEKKIEELSLPGDVIQTSGNMSFDRSVFEKEGAKR
jgi:hypothetical protein